eukprot:11868192-Ditylum_brightwellii.AAC.1
MGAARWTKLGSWLMRSSAVGSQDGPALSVMDGKGGFRGVGRGFILCGEGVADVLLKVTFHRDTVEFPAVRNWWLAGALTEKLLSTERTA